jgi:hypothetical protein
VNLRAAGSREEERRVDDVVCEEDEDDDEMKKRSDKVEWYTHVHFGHISTSTPRAGRACMSCNA